MEVWESVREIVCFEMDLEAFFSRFFILSFRIYLLGIMPFGDLFV